MKKKSIVIVFNDKNLAESTFQKLNLVRNDDKVIFVGYEELDTIKEKIIPSLIFLCHKSSEKLSIIKEIKTIFSEEDTPIILVTDKIIEDVMINAFEEGIDDFFTINDSEVIILMRILNTLKKGKIQQKTKISDEILISEKILDKDTRIYNKEFSNNILSTFFNQSIENKMTNNVFLHLKLLKEENKDFNQKEIGKKIKKTLRETDIISYGNNNNFNIFIENTDEEQTIDLINRINQNLQNQYLIYYTATRITKGYQDTIKIIEPLINAQIIDKEYFIFIKDIEEIELTEIFPQQQRKKLQTENEFIKKIEGIIAPVYYLMQTKYSERLKKAEINFCINKSENKFSIKKDEITNELSITYPTIDNINIDIKQIKDDNIIKNENKTYHTEEFNEELLTTKIEEMIKDFIEIDSINTINKETYETK